MNIVSHTFLSFLLINIGYKNIVGSRNNVLITDIHCSNNRNPMYVYYVHTYDWISVIRTYWLYEHFSLLSRVFLYPIATVKMFL